MPQARAGAVLPHVRPRPSFHFVAGKGGVGKTTLAAARAVDYAVGGRDVLCVSLDPAHSLADALSTSTNKVELTDAARPIALKRATTGRLRAFHLDADRALDRWLAQRRRVLGMLAARGTRLDVDEIDALLDLSLAGVDQLLALAELTQVVKALDPDIVVVDTAPTGHMLGALEMVQALERLAQVLERMRDAGPSYAPDDVDAADLDEAGALVVELHREARAQSELLRDPARSTWSWVTLADRASLAETKDGVAALERAGIAVDSVLVNRVITDIDEACSFCVGRAAAERPVLERIQRAFAGPGQRHRTLQALPLVDDEPRGEEALLALARSRAAPVPVVARGPAARRATVARAFSPATLALAPRRLVIVTGTGGAGKTSVASSIALAAARADPERRVLLASADPAHSLADVLGIPLGDGEIEVTGTTLRARELDAAAAFAQARAQYRKLDRVGVRELFDLAPPGLDELLAIVSVTSRLAGEGPGHRRGVGGANAARALVVLDTAPTGHALRLLHMPAVALDWLNALHAILVKERGAVTLEVTRALVEHARGLESLIALLHDRERAAIVVVTRAGSLPVDETVRLLAALDAAQLGCTDVVVNARAEGKCARCRHRAEGEERALAVLAPSLEGRRVIEIALLPGPPVGLKALASFQTSWRTREVLRPT